METIKRFWLWLIQKAPELKHLNHREAVLAYTVSLINQQVVSRDILTVPLYQLEPIHPVNWPTTREKLSERVARVRERQREIEQAGRVVTQEFLKKYLPSITWIKAVAYSDGTYVTFEGNGRVLALKEVFKPADNIKVEVEVYDFADPAPILKQVHQTRRLYGLEK